MGPSSSVNAAAALGLGICILLPGGCGNDTVPEPQFDGEVLVRVDVVGTPSQVSYRVWDERHELIRDVVLQGSDFPRFIRIFPAPSDETGHAFRWARLEVELWSEGHCPYARRVGSYRFGATPNNATLLVGAESDRIGSEECRALFVDARDSSGGGSGGCSRDMPCSSINQAIGVAEAAAGAERPVIMVAGDFVFPSVAISPNLASGTLANPTVLRAWPGRGLPLPVIEGGPVALCCNPSENRSGFELDGFELRGSPRSAVELQGTHDVRVRNCYLHNNTFEADTGSGVATDRAAIRVINSWDVVAEHNLIENNTHPGTLYASDGFFAGYVVQPTGADPAFGIWVTENRILNNQNAGIRLTDVQIPSVVTGNTSCRNGGPGLRLEKRGDVQGRVDVLGNAFLQNTEAGLRSVWLAPVFVLGNTMLNNMDRSLRVSTPASIVVQNNILLDADPEFATENELSPNPAPAVVDCLPEISNPGICPTFPSCPE